MSWLSFLKSKNKAENRMQDDEVKPYKMASVYLRRNNFYISTKSLTTLNLWVGAGPHFKVGINDPNDVIGAKVFEALAASKWKIEVDTFGTDWTAGLLELAGIKSWSTFLRGMRLSSVEDKDSIIKIKLQKRDGAGHSPAGKEIELSSDCSPAELGMAINAIFNDTDQAIAVT